MHHIYELKLGAESCIGFMLLYKKIYKTMLNLETNYEKYAPPRNIISKICIQNYISTIKKLQNYLTLK
jgi:hypothetical protein